MDTLSLSDYIYALVSERALYIYICVCVCVYICVYICVCVYIHTYIHTYMHACIHTYRYIQRERAIENESDRKRQREREREREGGGGQATFYLRKFPCVYLCFYPCTILSILSVYSVELSSFQTKPKPDLSPSEKLKSGLFT